MSADDIVGIFPTPILVARSAIPPDLVAALIAQFDAEATGANVRTTRLTHTPVADPRAHENFIATYRAVAPRLAAFGEALMGERMTWAVKEIWINRLDPDGAQKMHNHANSFVSGILYLTDTGDSVSTAFHRPMGTTSFFLENQNERCTPSPYNTPVYRPERRAAGDLVLFPSYLLHEVPPNTGEVRYTAAFNAVPERLDSWGYRLSFR